MPNGGCPSCGQNDVVKVNGKDYCANCGAPIAAAQPAQSASAPQAPPIAQSTRISDLRPQNGSVKPMGQVIDLRQHRAKPVIAAVANQQVASPRIDLIAPTAKKQQRAELAQSTSRSAEISKFTPAAPAEAASPSPRELPSATASVHQAMQKLAGNLPEVDIAPTAMPTKAPQPLPKTGLAVAAVVIAALGAYTWYVNYPKMAVKLAGARAGIQADFPAFIPSSYRLSGAVSYAAGEVSYQLSSPSADKNLIITQRRTSWDSKSLLENYVKTKTDTPLTVSGQGLTVYLYADQATWVNQGIWYTLGGAERLNREQILKIAYSI